MSPLTSVTPSDRILNLAIVLESTMLQKLMDDHKLERKFETNNPSYALLKGKLFDDKGTRMTPSYSTRSNNQRYRYYVSLAVLKNIPEKEGY